ncbi:MAG: nucleotidyltransferase family protein [Ktedonobacterales bacterium]
MQALILAGGAGTRLRSVLGDNLNKPMAPIAGKPFLDYLIARLQRQGIDDIILCVGYKADLIQSYFGDGARWGVHLSYSRETDFLGTGGALKLAQDLIYDDLFYVLNGDSFFDVDLDALARFHRNAGAQATLALARVENAARYGAVRLDEETGRIVEFAEKDETPRAGLINGGVYLLTRAALDQTPAGQVCSLEREVFPALLAAGALYGQPFPGFFIDIGVPADYARLQADPSPLDAQTAQGKERSQERSQATW